MGNTKQFLGARIQEIRRQKGIKQTELAEMIDVDSKHISKIEQGLTSPTAIALIGDVLCVKNSNG